MIDEKGNIVNVDVPVEPKLQRFIQIDKNGYVSTERFGYTPFDGEVQSDVGQLGQIQIAPGMFVNDLAAVTETQSRRFIRLNENSIVEAIRWGSEIVLGEMQSDVGELGQKRLADGTFVDVPKPEPSSELSLEDKVDFIFYKLKGGVQ